MGVESFDNQIYTHRVIFTQSGVVMSRYQHTKGQINDNALEALLHDPLFRQRVEKNKKGKGSYLRKEKHGKQYGREASGKQAMRLFTTGFLFSVA